MTISDVRTVLLTGPSTNDPFFRESRKLRSAAIIEIETSDGVVGLGETYAGYFCPEIVPHVVDFYRPILIGQTVDDVPLLWNRMNTCGTFWGRVGLGSIVICGIEAALWDLKGKLERKPVYELLGGLKHESLPCYATGGPSNWPVEKLLKKVGYYRDCGFRAVKIGAGYFDVESRRHLGHTHPQQAAEFEAAKLRTIRESFGESMAIALDAHMNDKPPQDMWTREAAAAVVKACEPYGLLFLEEALPYRSAKDYAWLRTQTSVPIAGGECLTSMIEWLTYLDAGSFGLGQPDASFTSGLHQVVLIAQALDEQGCEIAPHAWGAGASLMQNVHVGFACRNTRILELPPDPGPLHTELYRQTLRLEDGRVLPPKTVGLGITLDANTKARYPYIPGSGEIVGVPGKTQNDEALLGRVVSRPSL
jgi:L-alanine-DL-glutamate epimerase-like enolase superfamily enzyme